MGSKLGWIIAAIILVIIGGIVLKLVVFPSPTRPSSATRAAGILDLHTIDASPELVCGFVPSGGGNAGDDYAAAISACRDNVEEIDRIEAVRNELSRGTVTPPSQGVAALEQIAAHLADGARKAEMRYVFIHTPRKFEVSRLYPPTDDFQDVFRAVELLGLLHYGRDQYADAEKIFQDAFVMGRHLVAERSRVDMVRTGLGLQDLAIEYLQQIYAAEGYTRPERIDELRRYQRERDKVSNVYGEKLKIVWNTRPHAGDIYNIIENDEDRAWRVDALLALGVVKFTAPGRGDQTYINELMDTYAESSDPLEAAAATAARKLTLEQFRTLGRRLTRQ